MVIVKCEVEFFVSKVEIRANLDGSRVDNIVSAFRGFMIQARPSEDGAAFGDFRLPPDVDKSRLFGCPDNTTLVRMSVYHCE